ncbi:MAG: sigma-70 domain-containing protein [Polyangiaceae bacterium]|nr:sigma-70 domain-containing protein [Polyangiaceae bacterium]
MTLRQELIAVVQDLLASPGATIELDAIGDRLGALAVTPPELEEVFAHLERAGRRVGGDTSELPSGALGQVIDAARELRLELGRAARVSEVAARAGLPEDRVRAALLLVQVMQR